MTDRTHYVGCWREHHECAVAIIERFIDGYIEDFILDTPAATPPAVPDDGTNPQSSG